MSGSIVHFLDALTYKGYVKVAGGQVVLLPFHSSVRLRFWKCLYGAAASLPPYFWSRGHVLIQPLITVAIWSGIWELHNIIWFALKVHMHVSQFPPPQIRTTHTHTHTHTQSLVMWSCFYPLIWKWLSRIRKLGMWRGDLKGKHELNKLNTDGANFIAGLAMTR